MFMRLWRRFLSNLWPKIREIKLEPSEFYDKRNTEENKKAKGLPEGARKVIRILSAYDAARFLDIGCGDVWLSKNIIDKVQIKEYHGIDISESGVLEAQKLGIRAIKLDINKGPLPYDDNYFDFVFAGELIEHLFDPDHLLSEVFRVLKEDGFFLITTPNLASWHNRIALLLGFQPHYSEVSTKYSVGKIMTTNKKDVSGHLRLFTLGAVNELLSLYNFKVVKSCGHGTDNFIDKYVFNYLPVLSTGLIVLSRKKRDK